MYKKYIEDLNNNSEYYKTTIAEVVAYFKESGEYSNFRRKYEKDPLFASYDYSITLIMAKHLYFTDLNLWGNFCLRRAGLWRGAFCQYWNIA